MKDIRLLLSCCLRLRADLAAIDEDDEYGDEETLLDLASDLRHEAILKLLLEKRAEREAKD